MSKFKVVWIYFWYMAITTKLWKEKGNSNKYELIPLNKYREKSYDTGNWDKKEYRFRNKRKAFIKYNKTRKVY